MSKRWILLVFSLLVLFAVALGSRGLNEPDEGRYANIGREMALSGDWWEPRLSGYAHYDKPPLIYWTTAAAFRLFGFNEWSARVPSLLGAFLAMTGVGWAAFRLRGPDAAWRAVLICGASVQFWALGRVLSPDMLLTGWCAVAIAAWAECRHRQGAWSFWLLSLAFWTLAWWTKATPALIPLAGLTAGVYFTGDHAGRAALRPWLMLPAIILLGSPWYLSMLHVHPELRSFFFGRELAGRMAGRVDGRHGSLVYYVPISLVGWLPWWPLAVLPAWRKRSRDWARRIGVEGWIVLAGLVIFSLAASKLPTYTLSLAPWAALVFARLIGPRPFLPALASAFGVTALVGALVFPQHESALGVNSSVREVAAWLKAHHARRVVADRYWPGLEFYLGDEAPRYVVREEHLQERASDLGEPPNRFIDPAAFKPEDEAWAVHFRKLRKSPLAPTGVSSTRIGDFEVYRMNRSAGL